MLHESVGGEEVLERAVEAAEFERERERTAGGRAERGGAGLVAGGPLVTGAARTVTGIGLALGWHGAGFTGSGEVRIGSVASLELAADGTLRILTAATEMGQGTKTVLPQLVADELGVPYEAVGDEMGQGTKTVLPQLVADELGVPYEAVEIAPQDTAFVPDSGPTVASRTVMVVGGMLIKAARRLRAAVEGRHPGRTFGEVYREDAAASGPIRIDERFEPYPGEPFDEATYRGDAYPAFGWASCIARVAVDLDTGEVTVTDVVAAADVGRVVHPVLAEGQVEGGTLQAVGYATIEEMKVADGRYVNDRLATYLIPTALDAPRITSILVEAPFSGSPHSAKGLGELPMDIGAPAVIAAIHDATGAWITDLPATPERVLAALGATGGPAGARSAEPAA